MEHNWFQLTIKVFQQTTTVKEEIKTLKKILQETKDQISKLEIHQLKTKEVKTLMMMWKTIQIGTILTTHLIGITLQTSIGITQTPPKMVVLYQITFQALISQ